MRRARPAAGWALGAVLAAGGCASVPPPPDFGPNVEGSKIAARVQAMRAAVKNVEGGARVRTETPEKSGSFDADVFIQRPFRFRQVGYAHGTEIFDLLLEGKELTVFNRGENTVIRHTLGSSEKTPASLSAVERFFANTPIAQLLLGPSRFDAREEWRELERTEAVVRFGLFTGARQTGEVFVENGTLLMREHRITPPTPGGVDLSVRFADWREVTTGETSAWWPHEIHVESKREKFYMAFWFDDVRLNGDLPDWAFDQEIPADARPPGAKD